MIWRSAINILWALVRNTMQGKHQCTSLHYSEEYQDWSWSCVCGAWGAFKATENDAIKSFGQHIDHDKNATARFREAVSIEGLVRK